MAAGQEAAIFSRQAPGRPRTTPMKKPNVMNRGKFDRLNALTARRKYATIVLSVRLCGRLQPNNGIARRRNNACSRYYPQVLANPGGGAEAMLPSRPLSDHLSSMLSARSQSGLSELHGIGRCSVVAQSTQYNGAALRGAQGGLLDGIPDFPRLARLLGPRPPARRLRPRRFD